MGPLATCDLYEKIILATPAASDQDHLHVIIDSNTDIPDRTAAILHGGEDPVPQLCRSARLLLNAGAEVLCMPCNTAHYFYDRVLGFVRAEAPDAAFVHMPRETARQVRARGIGTVGLLHRGAETLILGCTELPVAFGRIDFGVPTLDPTQVLAEAVVRTALG